MNRIIAGVDEVGRGSLIGPVYAAAVILDKSINFYVNSLSNYSGEFPSFLLSSSPSLD